jgi:hypothetical protein
MSNEEMPHFPEMLLNATGQIHTVRTYERNTG